MILASKKQYKCDPRLNTITIWLQEYIVCIENLYILNSEARNPREDPRNIFSCIQYKL